MYVCTPEPTRFAAPSYAPRARAPHRYTVRVHPNHTRFALPVAPRLCGVVGSCLVSCTHLRRPPYSRGALHFALLSVIVYLTQGARHSSYGQSTTQQLQKSVGLLYKHYNAQQRDDVVFLHTGDVDAAMQASVLGQCGPEARFVQLAKHHFQLPPGVDPKSPLWLFPNKFSAGYRHMVRFFTVGIWEVAAELGYQYVMRLDDDAFVLSPIRYNLFTYMAEHRMEYGFRLTSWEHGEPAQKGEFHKFVRQYAQQHAIHPHWGLASSCPDGALERFTPERCGQLYTIYNNFFVANVSFWHRPDVQAFVRHVDASKTIYYHRWGDALWHSVALQLFLPRERVHVFEDFAYEHTSRKIYYYRGKPTVCFQWGGLALPNVAQQDPVVMGRARALTSINMCSRARGDVNRCFFTPRASGRLLGVFAGTVTPERPDVLESYCRRLRAEKESEPNAFCTGAAPRPFYCAPRRPLLNMSVRILFGGDDNRTFRSLPPVVDAGLKGAVSGYRQHSPKGNGAAPPHGGTRAVKKKATQKSRSGSRTRDKPHVAGRSSKGPKTSVSRT